MAGQFPSDFRAQLLDRVDIVEIIGSRVRLRKAGASLKGLCPFHSEKTPSFVVTPGRQTYHCFGCGAHGNAIDFLIEHDRLEFLEAVEELAQQVGLEVPRSSGTAESGPDPRPILRLLDEAAALFQQQLAQHPQAGQALDYLTGRGLSREIIARFGLGFAPPGWDHLLKRLGRSDHDRTILERAGLIVARDDRRRYDRFRNRVMFPIRDRRGRVVGFGGRVLDDNEPKYLNSPESPVFHKGRELYGLFEAQQLSRQPPRLLVVEGYMDVIALAQFGIPYSVATLGTATTSEQISRLLRSAPEVVFCFDGDRAGREAAWKALQAALPQTRGQQPIRFLFLPDGEDPDSLIRQEGPGAFEHRVEHATLLSDYLFERLAEDRDLRTAEGQASLDSAARPMLNSMPPSPFRDLLERRLAQLSGVPSRPRRRPITARGADGGAPTALTPLRLAIALLLDDPQRAALVTQRSQDWRELDNPGTQLLAALLDFITERPEISAGALTEHWRETEHGAIIARLSNSGLLAHIPHEGREQELIDAIKRLNREVLTALRQQLLAKAAAGTLTDEDRARLHRTRGAVE